MHNLNFHNIFKFFCIVLLSVGITMVILAVIMDRIHIGSDPGFGPAQQMALMIGLLLSIIAGVLYKNGCAFLKAGMPSFKIVLINVVIIIVGLEIFLRYYCMSAHQIPFFDRTDYQKTDMLLGWKGQEIFGDPNSKKFKVFFVGDSFTYPFLGRDTYYCKVKNKLNIEMFVYGGSGYGTLQEYLVIDKYIDAIKPDLVILQLCSNDFINNSWQLESRSYLHNNYLTRPYYENGKIVYRFSREPILLRKAASYSRLAYFVLLSMDRFMAKQAYDGIVSTIETCIEKKDIGLKEFRQSVQVTSELLGKIKERCGKIPLVAFSTFDDKPYFDRFKLILKDRDIIFLEEIPRLAWDEEARADSSKKTVKNNSHWTKIGHAACGNYIADYVKKEYFDKREQ